MTYVASGQQPMSRRVGVNPMQRVLDLLTPVLGRSEAVVWLYARNQTLGRQRPIELLAAGDTTAVLEEATRLSQERP